MTQLQLHAPQFGGRAVEPEPPVYIGCTQPIGGAHVEAKPRLRSHRLASAVREAVHAGERVIREIENGGNRHDELVGGSGRWLRGDDGTGPVACGGHTAIAQPIHGLKHNRGLRRRTLPHDADGAHVFILEWIRGGEQSISIGVLTQQGDEHGHRGGDARVGKPGTIAARHRLDTHRVEAYRNDREFDLDRSGLSGNDAHRAAPRGVAESPHQHLVIARRQSGE